MLGVVIVLPAAEYKGAKILALKMSTSDEHMEENYTDDPKNDDCVDEKSGTDSDDENSGCDSSECEEDSVHEFLISCVQHEQLDPESEDENPDCDPIHRDDDMDSYNLGLKPFIVRYERNSPSELLTDISTKVSHVRHEMKQRPLRIKNIERKLERISERIDFMWHQCRWTLGKDSWFYTEEVDYDHAIYKKKRAELGLPEDPEEN